MPDTGWVTTTSISGSNGFTDANNVLEEDGNYAVGDDSVGNFEIILLDEDESEAKYITLGSSNSFREVGGSTDLWSYNPTLSVAIIKSDNFRIQLGDYYEDIIELFAGGFDFSSIADDATIDGVAVRVKGYYSSGVSYIDTIQMKAYFTGSFVTDWKSPSTAANDDAVGTLEWSNPDNIKTSNNTYSVASGNYETTNYLKATNFGFEIPTGSTIDGIEVQFERKASDAFSVGDLGEVVKIVKSNGSVGSTDKGVAAYWSTTEDYVSYGGSTDKWGETWSAADINNSNFGVVLAVLIENYADASVDHVRIRVFYSEGQESTRKSLTLLGVS